MTSARKLKVLKIVFMSSSDLFGRITVYKLDVLGFWYTFYRAWRK